MVVSRHQIRTIHTVKNQLKLDDDTYRAMLNNYGVNSSKDLTFEQAKDLLNKLISGATDMGLWNTVHPNASEEGFANPKQKAKIRALFDEVSKYPPQDRDKALDKFILSRIGISKFAWLTKEGAQKAIIILEAMKKQKRLKEN